MTKSTKNFFYKKQMQQTASLFFNTKYALLIIADYLIHFLLPQLFKIENLAMHFGFNSQKGSIVELTEFECSAAIGCHHYKVSVSEVLSYSYYSNLVMLEPNMC